jgi:hypothetical protein
MTGGEEVIVPLAASTGRAPAAIAVRSTLVVNSVSALREHGLLDQYLAGLPACEHERVLHLTAGAWEPVELALSHYRACDALDIADGVIDTIGYASGRNINETFLKVISRLSVEAGLSPWSVLSRSPQLIERIWRGTAAAVYKLGPKEARFEWHGQPLAPSRYFRVAFGAFLRATLEVSAKTVYVRLVPARCRDNLAVYRCSWV